MAFVVHNNRWIPLIRGKFYLSKEAIIVKKRQSSLQSSLLGKILLKIARKFMEESIVKLNGERKPDKFFFFYVCNIEQESQRTKKT